MWVLTTILVPSLQSRKEGGIKEASYYDRLENAFSLQVQPKTEKNKPQELDGRIGLPNEVEVQVGIILGTRQGDVGHFFQWQDELRGVLSGGARTVIAVSRIKNKLREKKKIS